MTRSCTLSPCISQALYPILTVTMRTGNTVLTKGMGKVLNPPFPGPSHSPVSTRLAGPGGFHSPPSRT